MTDEKTCWKFPGNASASKAAPRPTPRKHSCVHHQSQGQEQTPGHSRAGHPSAAAAAKSIFRKPLLSDSKRRKSGSLPDLTAFSSGSASKGSTSSATPSSTSGGVRTPLHPRNAYQRNSVSDKESPDFSTKKRLKQTEVAAKELQRKLRDETSRADDLQTQLEATVAEKGKYQSKVRKLESTLLGLRDQLYNAVDPKEHQELKEIHNELNGQMKHLQQLYDSLSRKSKDQEEEALNLDQTVAQLNEQLESTRFQMNILKKERQEQESLVALLKADLKKSSVSLEEQFKIAFELTEQLAAKCSMVTFYEEELQLKKVDDSAVSAEDPNLTVGNISPVGESMGVVSDIKVKELEEAVVCLKLNFEEERNLLIHEMASQLKLRENEIGSLVLELNSKAEELALVRVQMGEQKDEFEKQITNCSEDKNLLVDSLEKSRQELNSKFEELSLVRVKMEKQKADFEEKRNLLTHEMASQLKLRENEIESLELELNSKAEELALSRLQMEKQKTDFEKRVTNCTEEKMLLEDSLKQTRQELNSKSEELSLVRVLVEEQKADFEKERNEITSQLKLRENEIRSLELELNSKSEELALGRVQMEGQRTEFEKQVTSGSEEKKLLEDSLEKTRQELISKNGELNSTSEELSLVCVQMEKQKADFEEERNLLSHEMDSQLKLQENEIESLVLELNSKTEELSLVRVQMGEQKDEFEKQITNCSEDKKLLEDSVEKSRQEQNSKFEELSLVRVKMEKQKADFEEERNLLTHEMASQLKFRENEIESLVLDLNSKSEELTLVRVQMEEQKALFQDERNLLNYNMASQMKQREDEIGSREIELNLKSEELASVRDLIEEQRTEFEKQFTNSREEKKLMEDSLKKTGQELNSKNEELNSKSEELALVRVLMEEQRAEFEKQVTNSREEKKQMEDSLKKSREEVRMLNNKLKSQSTAVITLREKLKKREDDLKDSYKDLSLLSAKVEERGKRNIDHVTTLEAQVVHTQGTIEQQNSELMKLVQERAQYSQALLKRDNRIKELTEHLRLSEESFNLERMHKDRYYRENCKLELLARDLRKAVAAGSQRSAPNMTFATTVHVGNGNETAAANFLSHLSSSLVNDSMNMSTESRKPPPGSGGRFVMADEEGEFMNPSHRLNLLKSEPEPSVDEDSLARLSLLQRRNTLLAPHLRSSYPAEMQNLSVSEKDIRDGSLTNLSNRVLSEISNNNKIETTSYSVTEFTNSRYRKVNSSSQLAPKNQLEPAQLKDGPSLGFFAKCSPTKLFKRGRNRVWTPLKSGQDNP